MRSDQKNEILVLYLGYFVTLALGLIPTISYYALGVLVLQAFYALIRYMSTSETVFRSHLFNYLLGVGVSFAIFLVMGIQVLALGVEIQKAFIGSIFGTGFKSHSAVSFGYAAFMMLIEFLVAIFWPIVLISRGLYLLSTGVPIFAGFRKAAGAPAGAKTAIFAARETREISSGGQSNNAGYLLSAILPNGNVVRQKLPNSSMNVIGRDSSSDLLIDEPTVSRRHAMIEIRDGVAFVKDLGSTSGTKVGGRNVGFNPVELRPSDTLQIGAVSVTISAL